MKKILKLFFGALITLLVLELVLWFLPVMHGWGNPPVTDEFPMVRFFPNSTYTYSRAWNFLGITRGRFNNLGYPAPDVNLKAPTLAIVGDSFIEAAMIEPGKRMSDIVAQNVPLQVAAFGASGADLPDYMVAANWITQNISTRAIVFVITAGDLAASIRPKARGYWYQEKQGNFSLKSKIDFGVRNALVESKLFSYLYYQLKIGPQIFWDNWRRPDSFARAAPGMKAFPPPADSQKQITSLMQAAASRFIADAAAIQQNGVKVVLLFDADRRAIYHGGHGKTVQELLMTKLASEAGLRTVSLADSFAADYKKQRISFEYANNDSHWNFYGQKIVASALIEEFKAMEPEFR